MKKCLLKVIPCALILILALGTISVFAVERDEVGPQFIFVGGYNFSKAQAEEAPKFESSTGGFTLIHNTTKWYSGLTGSTVVTSPNEYYVLVTLMRKGNMSFSSTGDSRKIYGIVSNKSIVYTKDPGVYKFFFRAMAPTSNGARCNINGTVRM